MQARVLKPSKFHRDENFYPDKPVYVMRRFEGSGRIFIPGDQVKWRDIPINERRMKILFRTHHFCHKEALPEVMTVYNPAKTLIEMGYTPEKIRNEFSKEQVRTIHATKSREQLLSLLKMLKGKGDQ